MGAFPLFFIGTSGWTYDHWKGCFYPAALAKNRWFDFYTTQFNAVEVNATFYRAFPDTTYLKWKERAPQDFGYLLKAPKNITHRKLLRDVEGEIQAFCCSAALLGDRFEMILLQVAPNLPYDHGLLRAALQSFTDPGRVAVEFRNERWNNPETEALLGSLGVAWCNPDSPRKPLTEILTSERAYLRLHGRDHWYYGNYPDEELREIAKSVHRLVNRGAKRVYAFFNNDFGGFAPANARVLQKLLID